MSAGHKLFIFFSLICFVSFLAAAGYAAHLVEQQFDLQPGWNAVYIEVEPPTNNCSAVFADVPIASVWTWVRRTDSVEFFQNLSEELHDDPHWLVFFPTNRYEKMFNDLYRVLANRPYFIRIEGTNTYSWTVAGRPALPAFEWNPNEFNMVGFPLDPAAAQPSVQDFLATDPSLAGQAVYRLNATGAWELVESPAGESMRAGESMWVYAAGESGYLGPLSVSLLQGDGLDFGSTVTELPVYLQNLTDTEMDVTVANVASGAGGPVSYWTFDTNTLSVVWQPLPDPLNLTLEPESTYTLRLAVERGDFPAATYETTVEILGERGTRVRIPLSATQ